MLKLELFGPGKAHYLDHALNGFPNQHCYLLFCYLLLNRDMRHSREQLATLFWADDSPATSRKYLRNNFWRLRRAMQAIGIAPETYLDSDHEHIAFVTSSQYWLDIEQFETVIAACQNTPGDALSTAQAGQLQEAMALYRGDLLQGVYEDWCLQDRERLRVLYLNSLSKLMIFHERQGAYEEGLACGERILKLDNVRESVHRRMMRLYWRLGDHDAAVAQYQRCVEILADELGILPLEHTQQLYEQIISNPERAVRARFADPRRPQHDEAVVQLLHHVSNRLSQLKQTVQEINREIKSLETLLKQLMSQQDQSTNSESPDKTQNPSL